MIKQQDNYLTVQPIDLSRADEAVRESSQLLTIAQATTIKSQDDLDNSAHVLKQIKTMAKSLEEARKAITTPLDTAKKAVMDLFRVPTEYLERSEQLIKKSMITYTTEQERIRLEEEEKQRKRAEAEEGKRKADLEEQAKRHEEKGNFEKAEERRVMAEQTFVPRPVVAQSFVNPKGITEVEIWKFKILDATVIPREYLIPDEKMIGAHARGTKGKIPIPGIYIYNEKNIRA